MNKKGFTLIELLVVVLIIGILSAVALPQYQKTVLKSRAAEAWTNLSALKTAAKVYCLENPTGILQGNGEKPELSISVKNSKYFEYIYDIDCSNSKIVVATQYFPKPNLVVQLGINDLGYRVCKDLNGAEETIELCKSLGMTTAGTGDACLCGSGDSCFYIK